MKTSTSLWLATAALGTLAAVGYGAWTAGMNAGMTMKKIMSRPWLQQNVCLIRCAFQIRAQF